MEIKTNVILMAMMAVALLFTTLNAKEYKNINGKTITNASVSEACEDSLEIYLASKKKLKLFAKNDVDDQLVPQTKELLVDAINAKAECTLNIPKDWETELDANIKLLSKVLKD